MNKFIKLFKKVKDEFGYLTDEPFDIRKIIPVAALLAVAIIAVVIVVVINSGKKNKTAGTVDVVTETTTAQSVTQTGSASDTATLSSDEEKQEDPQYEADMGMSDEGSGASVTLSAGGNETADTTIGIDVSKYQGTIDWAEVASSGVDFAMIRVGYRTQKTGVIYADTNAKYNMQQAAANGIKVGVYFFSSAVNEREAIEEAGWVADYIANYNITYPVAFDCEGFDSANSRQNGMSNDDRTNVADAFLQEIYSRGYTPMFYASASHLTGNSRWNTSTLENNYKMWVAQYPSVPYPDTSSTSYSGACAMWQYTSNGNVSGISTNVDINVAYFGYSQSAGTMSGETIIATLNNGETVTRTGISDSGWSRLNYNGQNVYAVSSYLTTDLSAPTQTETQQFMTQFISCNDEVTPKDEVNLRSKPSYTDSDSVVVASVKNGTILTRTGYNNEVGWSRVVYNGQTLYCITSYLIVK